MTRQQKLDQLGRAIEHLECAAALAQFQSRDMFTRYLFDAVRSIGAVVEELVKEQTEAP